MLIISFLYERMQLVMVAMWAVLKERTGITDSDLKKFMREADAS